MATLTLIPTTVAPGKTIDVSGAGFNPRYRFNLTIVDSAGTEVGMSTNVNRPKRDGTFQVGVFAPALAGQAKVRAYQRSVKVAEASVLVVVPPPVVEPPPPPPPTEVPFLSRPASSLIVKDGGTSVLLENITIRGGSLNSPSGIGITIKNITGTITLRDIDLVDLVGGIYIYNCSGTLLIENIRSRNIGDNTIGSGHSNHIQLAECSFSGFIRKNKFLGGHTEDMLSTWHSGGKGVGQELIIEDNQLQGLVTDTTTARAWNRSSGTGIIISDGKDSPKNGYIIVRGNTLLTPGQVGIQHIDGPGIQTYNNIIYGEQRPQNNNPMTSWEGNPRGVVHDNKYCWTNENGSKPAPWFGGGGSLVATNNVQDCTIDPNGLRIVL